MQPDAQAIIELCSHPTAKRSKTVEQRQLTTMKFAPWSGVAILAVAVAATWVLSWRIRS
jgi:hypothetical protein